MKQGRSNGNAAEPSALTLLDSLKDKKSVRKDDVSALRAADGMLGLISFEAAAAMVAIERGPAEKCREWGDFLIEVLLDVVVWGERPSGIVTDQQAAWLLVQVGEVPTPACMALLVSVIEEAQSVPDWFTSAVRVRAVNALADAGAASQHAA